VTEVPRVVAAEPISTTRLDLVPVSVEHATEMAVVLDDPALHEFIGGAPETADQLRSRFARWTAGSGRPDQVWLNWVIRSRESGVLTGTVQATVHPLEPRAYAEVAWVVGTPWQRRGIATEAALALAEWLRANGIERLVAHIQTDHVGSTRVATAIGLQPTDRVVDGETEWASSVD
jgi:RimJ/RimL family protein N-acetyltransferase